MARLEITEEQFNAAITAAARAGAEAALAATQNQAKPVSFVEAGADAQFEALVRDKRQLHAAPLTVSHVPHCESPTGSSFTAKINHNGLVVSLEDYVHPDGVDRKADEGGLVPSGYEIGRDKHKQWKWESFWQADINTYVGKPLPAHTRVAAEMAAKRNAEAQAAE